jgi:hypothetical protein
MNTTETTEPAWYKVAFGRWACAAGDKYTGQDETALAFQLSSPEFYAVVRPCWAGNEYYGHEAKFFER